MGNGEVWQRRVRTSVLLRLFTSCHHQVSLATLSTHDRHKGRTMLHDQWCRHPNQLATPFLTLSCFYSRFILVVWRSGGTGKSDSVVHVLQYYCGSLHHATIRSAINTRQTQRTDDIAWPAVRTPKPVSNTLSHYNIYYITKDSNSLSTLLIWSFMFLYFAANTGCPVWSQKCYYCIRVVFRP